MSPVDLQATIEVNETTFQASVGLSPNDVAPIGQPEAEGGSGTTVRLWSSLRVRQAIVAWWGGVSSVFGQTLVAAVNAAAGRTALGLGNGATRDVGTTAGTVAAGDDPRFDEDAQTLTVASNATTLDIAARTGNKYLLTINNGTAAFTLTITNFPANPTWWEAEVIITTTQVPSSFTFAGTPAKRDVAGSTLADNPFAAGKITSLLLSKIAANRYTAQFAPAVDP
jgi:hypothetical protein